MRPGWHDLDDACAVRAEDGAPVEARVCVAPATALAGAALLAQIEDALGFWLVWEDAWRPDGAHARRPLDLAHAQPSHRVDWTPDAGAPRAWLIAVDWHARGPFASAWTKDEWFGPTTTARPSIAHPAGGAWARAHDGWRHHDHRTPGGVPGVLCVAPLGPRPVSTRRGR